MLDKNKYFEGNTYTLDPSKLDTVTDFNNRFIDFNPLHSESEYNSTKLSIEEHGQQNPIYILNGKVIDGRHRVKILLDLGRSVEAINIKEGLEDSVYYDLCNLSTTSGRTLTVTQRAIQAFGYTGRTGTTAKLAAEKFQISRLAIGYVKYLDKTKRQDILEELFNDNGIRLPNMTTKSKSLEFICKKAKELHEAELVKENTSERIQFNPDALITTEAGKVEYYRLVNDSGLPDNYVGIRMAIVELMNLKYKYSTTSYV